MDNYSAELWLEDPAESNQNSRARGGNEKPCGVYGVFEQARLARFNLSWVLAGQLTGNGDLPNLKHKQ
jgi:hypothetical protein